MNKCVKFVPEGYLPCTREAGHDGPCAHPPRLVLCKKCGWPILHDFAIKCNCYPDEPSLEQTQEVGLSSWIEFFVALAISAAAVCVIVWKYWW